MVREIPLYTVEGVPDADISTHPFHTEDGLALTLQRFTRQACDDVVLVIHGLTTSTDMFIMPEHQNLVRTLLDAGLTDVWCLDFRMSNRHPYNVGPDRYTLDDVALFDFPAALRTMRGTVGDRRVHVVCHCLGALSFMMSLFGGAVQGITSVIANSVALTPRVPGWSRVKGEIAPFVIEKVLRLSYLDPRWAEEPGLGRGKLFAKLVSLKHRECDVPACHMLSLMWGTGDPALYAHEHLAEVTHRRGGDLYGPTTLHYHRHVRKMLRAGGRAVKCEPGNPKYAALPDDYLARAAEIETPVLLVTGERNGVFADSNIVCHRVLEAAAPGRHRLAVFPRYGHQDVFMGLNVARDIFPTFVAFIEEQRARAAAPRPRVVARAPALDPQVQAPASPASAG